MSLNTKSSRTGIKCKPLSISKMLNIINKVYGIPNIPQNKITEKLRIPTRKITYIMLECQRWECIKTPANYSDLVQIYAFSNKNKKNHNFSVKLYFTNNLHIVISEQHSIFVHSTDQTNLIKLTHSAFQKPPYRRNTMSEKHL